MKKTARGQFQVDAKPLPATELDQQVGMMRMQFDKSFHGPLSATGLVHMMGVMNPEVGSGGYVAIEKVTGALDGRKGSFLFQHSSTMNRGAPSQSISVVPDSGTDQLKGLTGNLTIDIVDEDHFYTFEYELP